MNKDLKDIKFEDLKESPSFILGCYVFVALVVIGLIAFSIYSIIGIKADLVTTRQSYQTHLQEIATLEELRAQSQKAEEQLSAYKEVLPDSLGDIYLHAEGTEELCRNFGLKIVSFQDPVEEAADTKETKFSMSVEGSFENIVLFMQYVSTLRQIHRIDSINLKTTGEGVYTADLTIAILSQDGSTGLVGATAQ
ncbi:MAG: type 4a pilus biogenesis protein PilO [Clostridia bacterium]|nr:type 4a pilus biogenesis protein PilO [Clostridia bacterium]